MLQARTKHRTTIIQLKQKTTKNKGRFQTQSNCSGRLTKILHSTTPERANLHLECALHSAQPPRDPTTAQSVSQGHQAGDRPCARHCNATSRTLLLRKAKKGKRGPRQRNQSEESKTIQRRPDHQKAPLPKHMTTCSQLECMRMWTQS